MEFHSKFVNVTSFIRNYMNAIFGLFHFQNRRENGTDINEMTLFEINVILFSNHKSYMKMTLDLWCWRFIIIKKDYRDLISFSTNMNNIWEAF